MGYARNDCKRDLVRAGLRVAGMLVIGLGFSTVAKGQNLVHHWAFSTDGAVEDSGIRAASSGVLMGGATVSGGALRLDGKAAYVQFGANLVPSSPNYTVALFARAEAGLNVGASRDFISQGSSGAAFYIGVAVGGTSLRAGDNWMDVEGATFIADGQFHHYALVMHLTGSSFYVDGVLVATSAPFAGGAGGSATRLGRGPGSSAGYFAGDLADVRIYDDALSDEQVQALAAVVTDRWRRMDCTSNPVISC